MFNLAEIKDTIKIEPSGFRKKKSQAITDEINRKYANKVKWQSKEEGRHRAMEQSNKKRRALSTPVPVHGLKAAANRIQFQLATHLTHTDILGF
jgi:hypothetical protein